ncbi:MAG: hypothetical protein AABZ74_00105 [Cyanobacteriota bacterium]
MKKIINIFLISVFLFSCDGNNPSVTKNTAVTTSLSSEIGKNEVTAFDPEYKEGMVYFYLSSSNKSEIKEESTTQVIKVDNTDPKKPKVTLKISNTTIQNTNQTTTTTTPQTQTTSSVKEDFVENFSDGLPEKVTKNEKKEDITVLAGTFKDTTVVSYKFFTPAKIEVTSTLWLYKGIGAIKKVDKFPDGTELTTQLKKYKIPISKTDLIKFFDTIKVGTKYTQNNLDDKSVFLPNTTVNKEIMEIKDSKIKIKTITKDNKEELNDYSYDDFYGLKNNENFFIESIDKMKVNNKEYDNLFVSISGSIEVVLNKDKGLIIRKETLADNKKLLMEINE